MKVQVNLKYILALPLIIAFAFPVRIWWHFGPFASFCPLDVVLLTGLLLSLVHVLYSGKVPVSYRHVMAVLIVPLILTYCSLFWSVNRPETTKEVLIYSEAFSAFFISIVVFRGLPSKTLANMIGLLVFFIILTAFFSVAGFSWLQPQIPPNIATESIEYQSYTLSYYARLSHPYIGLSNNFATVLVFFPVLFSAYGKASGRHIFYWLAFLTGLAVTLSMSRGIIAAMIVGYTLYAVRTKNQVSLRGLWKVAIITCVLFLGVSAFLFMNKVAWEQLPSRLSIVNITARMSAYEAAVAAIAEHPVLGYGAGIALAEISDIPLHSVHNTFLQQILYFGVPGGCMAIGSILLVPFLIHNRRSKHMRERLVKHGLVCAIITQILLFMVQASFEGSVLRVFFYFSVGISLALIDAMNREGCSDFGIGNDGNKDLFGNDNRHHYCQLERGTAAP